MGDCPDSDQPGYFCHLTGYSCMGNVSALRVYHIAAIRIMELGLSLKMRTADHRVLTGWAFMGRGALPCAPMGNLIGKLLVLVLVLLVLLGTPSQPAWAAVAQSERVPLTLELLQQRIRSPAQSEGIRVIDLRRLVIDLRPDNGTFREQFYTLLQNQLQKPGSPLGLDLSYSLIQGEFSFSRLGLRTPLYGEALSPLFTPAELTQLQRDRRRLSQLSRLSQSLLIAPNRESQNAALQITVMRGVLKLVQTRFSDPADFANLFFLNRIEAQGVVFAQTTDWSQTRFSQPVSFAGGIFARDTRFRNSIFFARATFSQGQFQGSVTFQGSEFQGGAAFNQAAFQQSANFSRVQWQETVDFAQARWQDQAEFSRNYFGQSLFLTDGAFERGVIFRETQFNRAVNLRGTSIQELADFSYAGFGRSAYLNVAGLRFDPDRAKILGNPGQIGRVFSVPTLQGNENLLRSLVRNFRLLEQIPDANQVEYLTQRLRLKELRQQLFGVNLNTASLAKLQQTGFSSSQALEITRRRNQQSFRSVTELLNLEGIDLATFINVRDRLTAAESASDIGWLLDGLTWLGLSLLLLLSRNGTSFWLIFGVGLVTAAYFGVLFWLVDRWRRRVPRAIVPSVAETVWVMVSYGLLTLGGILAIFRTGDQPWLTLASLSVITVPFPLGLLLVLFQRGRYHDLMEVSYFEEEGTLRQLRLTIGRLPILPRYGLFRERYMPLLWDRRWNWLNYYDFSFNNLLKFGFNDIRLRDQHLPSIISLLAWYQWSLGILYIALLLWTLSRTIPGLNLLIYFK